MRLAHVKRGKEGAITLGDGTKCQYPLKDESRIYFWKDSEVSSLILDNDFNSVPKAPDAGDLQEMEKAVAFIKAGSEGGGSPADDQVVIYIKYNGKLFKSVLTEVV